jgi:hypothetical protein
MQLNHLGTLESRMRGNVPVRFGKGPSEKGRELPRRGPTSSFKRAAVKFGVARYLYRDGVPNFVRERTTGFEQQSPAPSDGEQGSGSGSTFSGGMTGNRAGGGSPPRSGKALFAWTKEQEQRHAVGLLKYLNGWAKLQEFPSRMVDWDADQVSLAYAEACRKLQVSPSGRSEAYEEALAN